MLTASLLKIGFIQLHSDPCVFVRNQNDTQTIMAVYVDDFIIISSTSDENEKVYRGLEGQFKIKRIGEMKRFVGFEVERDRPNRILYLSQRRFAVELVERFGLRDAKPISTPMEVNWKPVDGSPFDKTKYQSGTGGLNYLSGLTRPDLSFPVGFLQRYNANPTSAHWQAVNRVIRYVNSTLDARLRLGGKLDPLILGYSDSSYGDDPTTARSTTGYAYTLGDSSLVSWSSKRQQSVALSTTEAEYMAASASAKEAIWLAGFLFELLMSPNGSKPITVQIYGDNRGSLILSKSSAFHPRSKHINIRHHFVREAVNNGSVRFDYMPTEQLPADAFTKALPRDKLVHHLETLGFEFSSSGSSGSVGIVVPADEVACVRT
jgi:hypothetical protein